MRYAPVGRRPTQGGSPAGARGEIRVAPSRHLHRQARCSQPPRAGHALPLHGRPRARREPPGEFVTAPAPASASRSASPGAATWAAAATAASPADGYRDLPRARAQMPADFFLFVGDTIYADHVCGEPARVPGYDFVARPARRLLGQAPLQPRRTRRSRPTSGARRSTRSGTTTRCATTSPAPPSPCTEPGRRAFIDYFPIRPPREEPGRLYRQFRWGALLEVFILDTRQYRSPNTDAGRAGQDHARRRAAPLADRRGVRPPPRCGRWWCRACRSRCPPAAAPTTPGATPTPRACPRSTAPASRSSATRILRALRQRGREEPRLPGRRRAPRRADPPPPDARVVLPRVHRGPAVGLARAGRARSTRASTRARCGAWAAPPTSATSRSTPAASRCASSTGTGRSASSTRSEPSERRRVSARSARSPGRSRPRSAPRPRPGCRSADRPAATQPASTPKSGVQNEMRREAGGRVALEQPEPGQVGRERDDHRLVGERGQHRRGRPR